MREIIYEQPPKLITINKRSKIYTPRIPTNTYTQYNVLNKKREKKKKKKREERESKRVHTRECILHLKP